jgi:hypothetical protein
MRNQFVTRDAPGILCFARDAPTPSTHDVDINHFPILYETKKVSTIMDHDGVKSSAQKFWSGKLYKSFPLRLHHPRVNIVIPLDESAVTYGTECCSFTKPVLNTIHLHDVIKLKEILLGNFSIYFFKV